MLHATLPRKQILVAGAGIGGLTAALALLQEGLDVRVFERAPNLGEVGAGVQISPNGVRVLFELGLESELRRVCFDPVGRELRVWNTGQGCRVPANADYVLERFGFPHLTLHRADLHSILVEAVRRKNPHAIQLGAHCERFEQDTDSVKLFLGSGECIVGDALIGADGIHSRIREQLFGRSRAKFTGGIAWRGVIPVENLSDSMRLGYGQNWIGPTSHVVVYPIRRGELINVVAHVERDDWQVESWIERGDQDEFAADFPGWHNDIHELIRNIDIPYKWALFLHEPLHAWSVGRVTLLGDACHATLPYLAQGANMAIEDGLVLARSFASHPGKVPEALLSYERARIARTSRIVQASADNARRFHHPDLADAAAAARYLDRAWKEQMEIRSWIYEYDATAVAVETQ